VEKKVADVPDTLMDENKAFWAVPVPPFFREIRRLFVAVTRQSGSERHVERKRMMIPARKNLTNGN